MRAKLIAVLVFAGLIVGGCAHNSTPADPYDPFERTNRKVYGFNQKLDRYVLAPVASGYAAITPRFFRHGVDNFFTNAQYPGVILNNLLQGKASEGLADTGRFLINTTIGLLGVWDPAAEMGLERHQEDFDQTLAVWGANSGPYLELPLYGPSHARTLADYPVAYATNTLTYAVESQVMAPLMVLYVINKRALLDQAVAIREQAAVDPYLFTRSAYIQHRHNLIHDGQPPAENLYDEDLFEDPE